MFIARGYRRTQMADVARETGVSPGTLYGYVEGKEALFRLLVDRAFTAEPGEPPELPVRTPAPGATLARLRERLTQETALPGLSAALARGARAKAVDPRAELEGILRELYDLIEQTRLGIALIERSAVDQPQLATLSYVDVRRKLIERLTRYLERRIASGALRAVPDPATAARLVLETITWFARHRLGDADSANIDDATARETTIDFLVHGLAPVPERTASTPRRAARRKGA